MGQAPSSKTETKTEIPRLNVVSHVPLSSEMRSHIYQKLLELDQKLPQGSALSLTLTKVRIDPEVTKPPFKGEVPALKSEKETSGVATKVTKKIKTKRVLSGIEAQVEIFSPNGQMTARGFGTDLFESVSGSVASLIEEIDFMRASLQGDGRKAIIALAKRPHYLH